MKIGELIECINQAFSNDCDDAIETTLNLLAAMYSVFRKNFTDELTHSSWNHLA